MSIKNLMGRKLAKITGRDCCRCYYNVDGRCTLCHGAYMRCWHSITRPHFTERPGKHLRQDSNLTAQEQRDLAKIKGALREAGETARDGGLLGD